MEQKLHLQNNIKHINSFARAQLTNKRENFKDIGDISQEIKMEHSKYGKNCKNAKMTFNTNDYLILF